MYKLIRSGANLIAQGGPGTPGTDLATPLHKT